MDVDKTRRFGYSNYSADVWRRTLQVAAGFWGVCLVLVAIETAFGSNPLTATVFFLSLPALVGYLIWANATVLVRMKNGLPAVVAMGVYLLFSATLIAFVGLFAAANLKTLILGG